MKFGIHIAYELTSLLSSIQNHLLLSQRFIVTFNIYYIDYVTLLLYPMPTELPTTVTYLWCEFCRAYLFLNARRCDATAI